MWEEMADDSDDEGETPMHRPMRVPTKVEGLPDERKYDISSMLDEDDDPFGW